MAALLGDHTARERERVVSDGSPSWIKLVSGPGAAFPVILNKLLGLPDATSSHPQCR